jgi:hypothetical protein
MALYLTRLSSSSNSASEGPGQRPVAESGGSNNETSGTTKAKECYLWY